MAQTESMSGSPESVNDRALARCFDDKFSEAFELHLGGERALCSMEGVGGHIEVIGLNHVQPEGADNVRYLLWRGGLDFWKFAMDTDDESYAVNGGLLKITLQPEDDRPLCLLEPDDAQLMTILAISDQGEVLTQIGKMHPEDSQLLLRSLQESEVEDTLPGWLELLDARRQP